MKNDITGYKKIILGVQFLFVAFGATVLVPILTGIQPAIALFTAGVGTLIFHLITRRKVPVFLGSSFAFIAPIVESTKLYGMPGTLGGLIAVGFVYSIVSYIVKAKGVKFIEKLFPSVVVGPVITLIGLSLASVAIGMAKNNWMVAIVVLLSAIITVVFSKGMLKLIPIFIGIVVGYIFSAILGIVDYSTIINAKWIAIPDFVFPAFNLNAILYLIPVAIAPIIEHVGDMYAIGGVANKNFIKDPGLNRTLLGDGIATSFAGFLGGPPNTTYSEVTGAISLTKVTNPAILRIAAVTAILFSFLGKITGFLQSIPQAVLGGIMILLFGMIASVGIKILVDSKTDFNKTRNQVIVSVVLILGIGGASFGFTDMSSMPEWFAKGVKFLGLENFKLAGIGLASIVGVILNLILPNKSVPVDTHPATEEQKVSIDEL